MKLPKNNKVTKNTTEAAKQMIHTLHLLVCILMSPQDPDGKEIDMHVKLFLSCCHRFAKTYWDADVTPFWAKTGNFPTLLCLADQRNRHGPIRWYWEGTSERFIQQLKKHLVSMTRTEKYFQTKLRTMYRMNAFEWIRDQIGGETLNDERFEQRERNYYQYESLEDIELKIREGNVFCGFCIPNQNGRVYIAYGNSRRSMKASIIEVKRRDKNHGARTMGLVFHQCVLDYANKKEDRDLEALETLMTKYCIFLPLVVDGKFKNKYTCVYSDWDVGRDNLSEGLPQACEYLFRFDVMGN